MKEDDKIGLQCIFWATAIFVLIATFIVVVTSIAKYTDGIRSEEARCYSLENTSYGGGECYRNGEEI